MKSFRRFSEPLSFHFVSELAELVEVYARPETERVGHCLWRLAATRLCRFAQPGADCPIHRFLERNPKLSRALLQKPRQIVIDRQRRSHGGIMMPAILMSRHQGAVFMPPLRKAISNDISFESV
jgi:hypothetical protein